MNLTPLDINTLLRSHGLHPKISLGQNFLNDPVTLQRIVDAAEVTPQSTVLEIGPGLGSLTRYLAQSAHHVVAVELDQTLIPILNDVLAPWNNVTIVHGDILEIDPTVLMSGEEYFVVANIPYYITSALIRHLLESPRPPRRLVLTVQKEVASRITAAPGDLSLLALSVQVYGKTRIAAHIPAGAFYPPPKVDSAVVRVDMYDQPKIPSGKLEVFFKLIHAGFSQKRKTLRNAMSGGLAWKKERVEQFLLEAGIDPMRRAETLNLDEWQRLVEVYPSQS